MAAVSVLYIGAVLAFWLTVAAVVRYAFPDSLPGRVATVLT